MSHVDWTLMDLPSEIPVQLAATDAQDEDAMKKTGNLQVYHAVNSKAIDWAEF